MIWALFAVIGALLVYGIVTLIQFHLDGIRLQKLIRKRRQREHDKRKLYGNMETDTRI